MSGPTNWRDRIKVHPAADLFPMMSDAELQELARDIAENGLRHGVVFWTPLRLADAPARKLPDELYLVDGRNRLAAIELAYDDEADRQEAFENAIYIDRTREGFASLLYSEDDPYAFVVSANIRRRHLTAVQKREIIAELLTQKPERSNRATAKIANVSDKTVAAVRAGMEATAEIPQLDKTNGTDNKARPARKKAPPRPAAPSTPASQARDKAVAGFSVLLHQKLEKTLDDLTRLLSGESARIREIPRNKRISLARAYLDALGIGADDLGSGGER